MPSGLPSWSGNLGPTVMSSGLVQGIFRSGETAATTIVPQGPSGPRARKFGAYSHPIARIRGMRVGAIVSSPFCLTMSCSESRSRGQIVAFFISARGPENAVSTPLVPTTAA